MVARLGRRRSRSENLGVSQGQDPGEEKLGQDQGQEEEGRDQKAGTQDLDQGRDATDPDVVEGGDPQSLL